MNPSKSGDNDRQVALPYNTSYTTVCSVIYKRVYNLLAEVTIIVSLRVDKLQSKFAQNVNSYG